MYNPLNGIPYGLLLYILPELARAPSINKTNNREAPSEIRCLTVLSRVKSLISRTLSLTPSCSLPMTISSKLAYFSLRKPLVVKERGKGGGRHLLSSPVAQTLARVSRSYARFVFMHDFSVTINLSIHLFYCLTHSHL